MIIVTSSRKKNIHCIGGPLYLFVFRPVEERECEWCDVVAEMNFRQPNNKMKIATAKE